MRTHSDSIINIFRLTDDGSKILLAEKVLAKIEVKSVSEENEYGKRTFSKSIKIFFDRRTIKPFMTKGINWNTFQIQRIRIGKFEVDEWYMISGQYMFQGKSPTVSLLADSSVTGTSTNNFDEFEVV